MAAANFATAVREESERDEAGSAAVGVDGVAPRVVHIVVQTSAEDSLVARS